MVKPRLCGLGFSIRIFITKEWLIVRKKQTEFVNRSDIPDYAIERVARCILDDIRAAFIDEDVQRDFAIWQAERAKVDGIEKADLKSDKRNSRSC